MLTDVSRGIARLHQELPKNDRQSQESHLNRFVNAIVINSMYWIQGRGLCYSTRLHGTWSHSQDLVALGDVESEAPPRVVGGEIQYA